MVVAHWDNPSILEVLDQPVFWVFFQHEHEQVFELLQLVKESSLVNHFDLPESLGYRYDLLELRIKHKAVDFVIKVQFEERVGVFQLAVEVVLRDDEELILVLNVVLDQCRRLSKNLDGQVNLSLIVWVLNNAEQDRLLVTSCSSNLLEELLLSFEVKCRKKSLIVSYGLAAVKVLLFSTVVGDRAT